MGIRSARPRRKSIDEIPMAAMPDIAFLLLMFFMVSTTFLVQRSLSVELPAYSKEKPKDPEKHVTVFLAAESLRIEIGGEGETVTLDGLGTAVEAAIRDATEDEGRVVLLEIDDGCPYTRVIEAFDAIHDGGAFVTLVEAGDSAG